MQPHRHYFKNQEGKQIAYHQWGQDNSKVLLCLHGLTRHARDFDEVAKAGLEDYHIICPDMLGRGDSDWATQPEEYNLQSYCRDTLAILEHLQILTVSLLGTSMGGLMGMLLAASPNALTINALILNDVGPYVPRSALKTILEKGLASPRSFETYSAASTYLQNHYRGFGALAPEHWDHLVQHQFRLDHKGTYHQHYDANILNWYELPPDDVDLWEIYHSITCPILVLRGQDSPVLIRDTAQQLEQTPRAQVIEFPECGHAPPLMEQGQIDVVFEFLRTTPVP